MKHTNQEGVKSTEASSVSFFKDDNILLDMLSKTIFPLILLFGFYIHFHGDYIPGGGFQSGVIFATVVYLYKFTLLHKKIKYKIIRNKYLNAISSFSIFIYLSLFLIPMYKDHSNKNLMHFSIAIIETAICFVVASTCIRIVNAFIFVLKEQNILE